MTSVVEENDVSGKRRDIEFQICIFADKSNSFPDDQIEPAG